MVKSSLATSLASTSFRHNCCVLIITSGTGEKQFNPANQLTLEDFKNSARLQSRSDELKKINQQKEQFSISYMRAMATVAGYSLYRPEIDNDRVNLGIVFNII